MFLEFPDTDKLNHWGVVGGLMFPVRDGSLVEPLVMEAFCIGSPGGMGREGRDR